MSGEGLFAAPSDQTRAQAIHDRLITTGDPLSTAWLTCVRVVVGADGSPVVLDCKRLNLEAAVSIIGTIVDFETPSLGGAQRQIVNPYVFSSSGLTVTFRVDDDADFPDAVTSVFTNAATSACVEPPDSNQKLGMGRSDSPTESIGLSDFSIRVEFDPILASPVSISAEVQMLAGHPMRLTLYGPTSAPVETVELPAGPPAGTCGCPGGMRSRFTISATAIEPVASARFEVFQIPTGGTPVYVLDNMRILSNP